ncbi:unnamed protein product [Cuscuta epithymum]|uniref:Uncharacterized protein n=1 Tax=Cuscuta epithymum TaxID=186058 RepID=A0AAV0F5U0_9ASTE|nr:unnamed protein product [Cuscuta epithymum]
MWRPWSSQWWCSEDGGGGGGGRWAAKNGHTSLDAAVRLEEDSTSEGGTGETAAGGAGETAAEGTGEMVAGGVKEAVAGCSSTEGDYMSYETYFCFLVLYVNIGPLLVLNR